jgi:O-antigen/teichoic acid export membrane protein
VSRVLSEGLAERALQDGRTVARGSALLFASQVIGNAGFFAAVLILARGLGPAGRGAVAFFIVTAMVAARAVGLGVREATTVFAAQRPDRRPSLLSNLLLASVVTGAAGAAIVCAALTLFPGIRPARIGTAEVVSLGLAIVAFSFVDGGYNFLVGCSRFRLQALVTATSSWIYAASLLVLWLAGGVTVAGAAIAWTAAAAARAVFVFAGSARLTGVGRPDLPLLRKSIRFGCRAWIGSLARFTNFRADQVLMGFIASEASLGIYAVAVNASEILLYFPEAMAMALLPIVARAEPEQRNEQALRAFRSLLVVTIGSIVVAVFAAAPLLPVVFGSKFAGSTTPFLWLLPGAIGYAALGVFSNTLMASSPGLSSLGPFVSLVVGLALDVALIPAFGATGAAAAASAAFLAGGATSLVVYRRRAPFPWTELVLLRAGDLDFLGALVRLPFTLRARASQAPAAD